LAAGNPCTVQVQYTATDTARKTDQVVISLRQQGVVFSRTVAVAGNSLNTTGNDNDTGGGAVDAAWLLALAAATLLAARRLNGR